MAYSVPKRWSHGDTVSHTDMQKYSDGLNAIRDSFVEEKQSWCMFDSQMEDTQSIYIIHKFRWLIFKSTGEIQHPTDPDIYPSVSLSESASISAVDVDQEVGWLVPGALYRVVGCSNAYEDELGIIA